MCEIAFIDLAYIDIHIKSTTILHSLIGQGVSKVYNTQSRKNQLNTIYLIVYIIDKMINKYKFC